MEITLDFLLKLFTAAKNCLLESETVSEMDYYKGQCDLLIFLIKKEKKAKGIDRCIARDLDKDWRVEL